jgi:hypothetical protein
VSLVALAALSAGASTLNYNYTFDAVNQNMWSPGSAFISQYNKFYGLEWNKGPAYAGSDSCTEDDYMCGNIWGSTSGKVGLDVGYYINGGSVNASMPVNISVDIPDQVAAGGSVGLNFNVNYSQGNIATTFPTFSGYVDEIFKVRADWGYNACLVGCDSGSYNLINQDVTKSLLSINRNNDHRIIWNGSPLFTFGEPIDLGVATLTVNWPDLPTSGSGAGHVESSGQVNVLSGNMDLTNIATTLAGIPDLHNDPEDNPYYNLVEADAVVDLYIAQHFTLNPQLNLSVRNEDTGVIYQATFGDGGSFGFGESLPPGGATTLRYTPIVSFAPTFTNDTNIVIDPHLDLRALALSFELPWGLGGLSLGPLVDESWHMDNAIIDVFDATFMMEGFQSFELPTIEIDVTADRQFQLANLRPTYLTNYSHLIRDPRFLQLNDTPTYSGLIVGTGNAWRGPDFQGDWGDGWVPAPEPSSLMLMASGISVLIMRVRRQLKR